MLLLAAALFFGTPSPVGMPRADAYLVRESSGEMRLEDRFDTYDLWRSRAVIGRWYDEANRVFTVARLDAVAPKGSEAKRTRGDYVDRFEVLYDAKDRSADSLVAQAVDFLSPVDPAEDFEGPAGEIRGMKEVRYWEGTNASAIVCSFLPEESPHWYFASWLLAEGDDPAYARDLFETEFLRKWSELVETTLVSEQAFFSREARQRRRKATKAQARRLPPCAPAVRERELLRADTRHCVTNYASWHVTDSETFLVLDNLRTGRAFLAEVTNDFARMRRRYAEVVPSPLNVSNVLAVARLYADRDEYLAALDGPMQWSAAYWSPRRRELVAHLPQDGEAELLKTLRHEAFHQYLSYACSMISASPWINEGYAQYFEDEESGEWELDGQVPDLDAAADMLPGILSLDYEQFYDGSDLARRYKYRLAWSVAFFLEKGAPKIRFEPFKDLKRDYVAALLRTRDMRQATAAAFGTKDRLELFVREWKKFWSGD